MTPSADIIDAFIAHLTLIGRSDYTTTQWRGALLRADRALPFGLEEAEGSEIQQYLGRRGWAAATRVTYWQALSSFYRWATDPRDEWLELDPMEDVTPPPRAYGDDPNPCTDDELAHLLTHAAEPYRLWFLIAAYTGARCKEIAGLDREHVTETHVRIISTSGKGGKPRTVPTHPMVWQALRDRPPGALVRIRRGPRAGQRGDGRYVSARATGYLHVDMRMPDMHMHRLRDWFASRALEAIGDIRVVQELVGHSSVATTQRYTAVANGRREAAVSALPAVTAVSAAAVGG